MRKVLTALGVVALAMALVLAGGYKLINSRTFQVFGEHAARVDTSEKVVALTFDDGPTCPDLGAVLSAMSDVKATFFVNGQSMEECPEGAPSLVESGHELGNHTWSHRYMVFISQQDIEDEMLATDELIAQAGGSEVSYVRPPYGKKLFGFPWWLAQHDRYTVMWDVSEEKWSGEQQSAEEIAEATVGQVRPGSIVLLHPWSGRVEVQKAIPLVIEALRAEGYSFVTVSELLGER